MKKSYKKILSLLAVASMALGMNADELTVINGTPQINNSSIPINSTWVDTQGTISQCIYPAQILGDMNEGTITAIKFYVKDDTGIPFYGCTLQFSIGETEQTTYSSATAITGLTPVATIEFTEANATATELLITFDAPYEYHGGNLVFESKVTTAGTWKTAYFLGQSQSSNTAFSRTERYQFLPMATFTYEVEKQPYAASVKPAALDFGDVLLNTESTLNVTLRNKGLNAFTPALSGLAAPFSTTWEASEIATDQEVVIPVTFSPTELTDATGTLTINCGEAGTFEVALSGTGSNIVNAVVCDGSNSNMFVPVYGYWSDMYSTKAQMIYPAEMLTNLQGQTITGVTFFNSTKFHFNNTNIQLSMVETEQSVYEQETANSVPNMIADMPVVANAAVTTNDSELVFTFNEPIIYNGGNLALDVTAIDKSTGVGYDKDYWIGENFSEAYSCYTYNTTSGLVYFLPKAMFSYQKAEETPALQGDVNNDGEVDVRDITALIDVIMNSVTDNPRADVNGDTDIDVRDITALIDIIMNN